MINLYNKCSQRTELAAAACVMKKMDIQMENVIEFTAFKTDHNLYDEEARRILESLPKEQRNIIRKAFESSISKYLTELSKPTNVQVHPESTKEQIESISSAIKKHQEICKELMQQLGMAKAAEALRACNNS